MHLFDRVPDEKVSGGLRGLFDSITIVLSTPCEWFPLATEERGGKADIVV